MAELSEVGRRIALVTGAAQGIGFSIAQQLAVAGVDVVIADLDSNTAVIAANRIASETGAKTYGIAIDVSRKKQIDDGIAKIHAEFGVPTILVNNAGLYRSTPILELKLDIWQLLLDVMLTGPLLLSQALIPAMIEQKWGRIINMGSYLSAVGFGEDVAYCVAKTGIIGITHSLSAELAKYNICVNAICPGNVLTELMENTAADIEQRDGLEVGQFLRERAASIPLGRLGDPVDIANLAVFLCSEQSGYVTGQSWHINGGLYQT